MSSGRRARRWQSGLPAASVVACALLLAAARCTAEPVDLSEVRFVCASDSDCVEGFVCGADDRCMPVGGDAGCVSTAAAEDACHGGIDEDCDGTVDCADPDCADEACTTDGAWACRAGACECAVSDIEIVPGTNAGGTVVPFEGRLAWILGGGNGDILYGECVPGDGGNCDAPVTRVLETPSYPKQRPVMRVGGAGLIAAWRRGGGALGFGECAGGCLDGGFQRVALTGQQIGAMPPDLAAVGSRRAVIAMDQTGRVLWLECADQCSDPAQWSSRILSTAAAPRGLAALLWEEEGVTRRMASFGDPLRTRSCSGDCTAPASWTPALTLDSDSFQPRLQRTDAGDVALFARSEALKKLFAFVCESGKDCAAPQSWVPIVAWTFPAGTREYGAAVTPDGRFAFATSGPVHLFAGSETNGGFVTTSLPLCDGTTVSGREPSGFVDSRGRWTLLYHSNEGGTRLYLPRR